MASLAQINRRIHDAGYTEVELVRGEGYCYFVFDDNGPNYETESVPVPYLKQQTAQEWVEQAEDFGDRMREKAQLRAERGCGFRGGPFGSFAHRAE